MTVVNFRKQSTTDQSEKLVSLQRSIVGSKAIINKQSTTNDFIKDKFKNLSITKIRLELSEAESSKSSRNSSKAQCSVLNMHKRSNTVLFPILSSNKANNNLKSPLNQRSDSNSSV